MSYDEGQGIGKSLVFVRDPRGLMTKARLMYALIPASWTPATVGPFEPSVTDWPSMSDTLKTNQDTITALWNTQQGTADAWSFAKFFGTVLKVGAVGAIGIILFSLYARAMPEPRLPRRRAYR